MGLARAKGYEEQVKALGPNVTALVNVITALAEKQARFVPEVLVTSGNSHGALEGLAATLMRYLSQADAASLGKPARG